MGWKERPNFSGFVDASLAKQVRLISFKVMRGVIMRTPVDEGRLKGNWQLGVGSAPDKILETVDATTEGSFDAGRITTAVAEIPEDRIRSSVYIVNNLPYAEPIEYGHGGRNPGVMVEATLRSVGLK